MFEVDKDDGRTIRTHRGDKGILAYSIPLSDTENFKFEKGDIIKFTVFEKNGYDKEPVLTKEVEIQEQTEEVLIELNSEDTNLGEASNKIVTYWYEISLNNNETTLGYDEDEKAAEFKILPAYAEGGTE